MPLWQRVHFACRCNQDISSLIALRYGSRRHFAESTPSLCAAEQDITLESTREAVANASETYNQKIPLRKFVARASKTWARSAAASAHFAKKPEVANVRVFRKVRPIQDLRTVASPSSNSASSEEIDRNLTNPLSPKTAEQSLNPLVRIRIYEPPFSIRSGDVEVPLSIKAVRRPNTALQKTRSRRLNRFTPAVKAKLGRRPRYTASLAPFIHKYTSYNKNPPAPFIRKCLFNDEKLAKKEIHSELDGLLYAFDKVQLRKPPDLVRDNAIEWPSRQKHQRWQRLDQDGQPIEGPSQNDSAGKTEETILEAGSEPLRISLVYDDDPLNAP